MTTTAERLFALIQENIGWTDGDERTVKTIAAEIDNLTARLGAQVDLTIETEKQLAMVRVTRDAYLRELETLRADNAKLADRLARTDVGPRPTDERIADALEKIAASLSMPVGRTMRDAMDEAGDDLNIAAVKATDLFTGKPFQP